MKKAKTGIKTEWDLKKHFYSSEKDPRMQKDLEEYKRLHDAFEKKYKGKTDYLKSPAALRAAIDEYNAMSEQPLSSKAMFYLWYRTDLNSEDKAAEALYTKLSSELAEYENKVLFFPLSIGNIPQSRQKAFLDAEELSPYRYMLKVTFDKAKYKLSEPEEKILNLKSLPAREMWTMAADKLQNKQTIKFKGKEMPLAEASSTIPNLPDADRRKLHSLLMARLKEISHMAEAEINALYTDKKINDKLRGYAEPYSAAVLSYQNDESTILALVEAVTKAFSVSHRFYRVKARLMGLPQLGYSDRGARIGKTAKKISFEESYGTLRDVFGSIDPEFRSILEKFAAHGHIDVFPKKGKTGGAYCSHGVGLPTFVLMNYTPDLKSLMTFAHEMGHAIHSEFSKIQPRWYQDYTISAAEVASTLFESLTFDYMFEKLSEKDKLVALHDRVNDSIATVFRQIACFNFELELHRSIREKGNLPKEDIAKLLNKHMKSYLGPKFKLDDGDGYFFVSWSHIRRHFYVYSYAYGELISKALYRKYKRNPEYMKEIKKFLSAGGSMSPDDIFTSIGVDTRDPKFWEEGLKQIEDDIKKLEKLASKK